MKVIIQIPCLNEEDSLPLTLSELPKSLDGVDIVEWLVIDDGSTDKTVEIAKEHGAHHVVSHLRNKGLAKAFMTGIDFALRKGADIIVNTDGDNQYSAKNIQDLINPIIKNQTDLTIGNRQTENIDEFSKTKKLLQKIGSSVVKKISKADIKDAPSGFRAISRNAAKKIVIFDNYTYTLDTILQASSKNISITTVDVDVNPTIRPSRLIKSIPSYISKSIISIIRVITIYKPFKSFASVGILIFLAGFLIGLRYLVFIFNGNAGGNVQSLILAGALLAIGFQTILVAFLADLISSNRKLLEEIRYFISDLIYDK
ncbi:MAG: glycosyltransferase family 2 protein [Flavobacteriales bacterium]|nr:glycosyltransferase family 2 protein [Flavobacteriales bacterium]